MREVAMAAVTEYEEKLPKNWTDLKRFLVDKKRLPKLFCNYDRVPVARADGVAFEPLVLSKNAQRLSELVDRCMAIRKEIRELEILAVKAETDYELFESTSAIDKQVDELRLQLPAKTKDQAGFAGGATALSGSSSLEKGLGVVASGHADSVGADLADSGMIKTLLGQRWDQLSSYQEAYHGRHQEPGNAHNFAERAELSLKVFAELCSEALGRALAVSNGIKQIYGADVGAVPASITIADVDTFAIWSLRTLRALAVAAEQETVTDVVVPLTQPWLTTQTPLISRASFDTVVQTAQPGQLASFLFTLPADPMFDPQTRIKGVGIAFGNHFNLVAPSGVDRNQTADTFTRVLARITTPPQTGADGNRYQRPIVTVGNVGLHGTNVAETIVEGPSFENVCPFGDWKLELNPLLVWKEGSRQLIGNPSASDRIQDLKLTLRLFVPGTFRPLRSVQERPARS